MNLLSRIFRSIGRLPDPFRLLSLKRERRRSAGSARKRTVRQYGPARDFSTMPLPETMAELRNAANTSREVFVETLRELAAASDSRDPYTRGHSERVTRFSAEIARIIGLPEDEVERVRIGALIHDIGKITIAEEILNKPSALTRAEYELMKMHTTRGYELLKHIPQLKNILPGMQFHHELLDGTGYPHGLNGDEIPNIARIITVADCFDAMTTIRPYQDPAPVEHVLGSIRLAAGVKYDERVVEALVHGVSTGRIVTRLEDRIQAK